MCFHFMQMQRIEDEGYYNVRWHDKFRTILNTMILFLFSAAFFEKQIRFLDSEEQDGSKRK